MIFPKMLVSLTPGTDKSIKPSVALVTGASSGIGWETACLLAQEHWTVFAASRSIIDKLASANLETASSKQIIPLKLDVLDDASCQAAVATILERTGQLDALVHCAGSGIAGAIEEIPIEDAIWQYDNLLFGTIRMIRAVLPHFRKLKQGRLVLVTSVAATIPIPFQSYYSSAKAAVHALALGLADEVYEFGIQVSIVSPGDTKTGFTSTRKLFHHDKQSPYYKRVTRSVDKMAQDEMNGMPANIIAQAIHRELIRKQQRIWVTPGLAYQILTVLNQLLPIATVRWFVRKIYG